MAITEANLGGDHASYAVDLNNLAKLLENQVKAKITGAHASIMRKTPPCRENIQ